jgi:peptide/nickel transport system substrate-binding protein
LPNYTAVLLNLRQPDRFPFFQELAVRQALFTLIDRQKLIDQLLAGQGILANGPFVPWSWPYNPEPTYPAYDVGQAIDLLTTAGWVDHDGDGIRDKDGVPLSFELLTDQSPAHVAVADFLAQQWALIGISVSRASLVDINNSLSQGQFSAVLVEIQQSGEPDPYSRWHQTQVEGGQNFSGWDNVAASQQLEQARLLPDRASRLPHYYQFQSIFAQELPALILYYPVQTYAVRDSVKNVQLAALITPADRFRTISDWYLLTRRVIKTSQNQDLRLELE